MTANKTRCAWTGSDPLMQAYHDEEWGAPEFDSRMLWETLMLEGFQAGLAGSGAAQARGVSPGVPELRPEEGCSSGREGHRPAARESQALSAAGPRSRRPSRGLASTSTCSSAESSSRILRGASLMENRFKQRTASRHYSTGRDDLERAQGTRIQVRGSDDRVCVDAGGWAGEVITRPDCFRRGPCARVRRPAL